MTPAERWRIELDSGEWRSVGGPDYERESAYRVIDTATGETVLTFTEFGDWMYMAPIEYYGTAKVELAADGSHVIVTDHDGSVKTVPLPS